MFPFLKTAQLSDKHLLADREVLRIFALRLPAWLQVKLMADSAVECARLCYQRACSAAGFYPPEGEADVGICLLSLERRHPSVALCAQHDQRFHDWASPVPTLILCLDCSPPTQTTPSKLVTAASIPDATTVATTPAATPAPTPAGTTPVDNRKPVYGGALFGSAHLSQLKDELESAEVGCGSRVEFGVTPLLSDSQPPLFHYQVPASSPRLCALLCYQRSCNLAAFMPPSRVTTGLCLLSMAPPDAAGCPPTLFTTYEASDTPLLIYCLKCRTPNAPVVKAPVEEARGQTKRVEATQPIKTTAAGTEAATTTAPLRPGQVECFNCVAEGVEGACDANVCRGNFCLVQAIQNAETGKVKLAQSCSLAKAPESDGCSRHESERATHTVCACRAHFCNSGQRISEALGWNNLTRTTPGATTAPTPRDRNDPRVGRTNFQPSRGSAASLPQSLIPECAAGVIFRPKRAGDSASALRSGFNPRYRLRKNTPGACAEICYYTGCSEAHFNPADKLCMLSYAKTASSVRRECNAIKGGFVREFRGPPVFLSCVICGAPIDAAVPTRPVTTPPIILPVIRPKPQEEKPDPVQIATTILTTPNPTTKITTTKAVASPQPPSAAPAKETTSSVSQAPTTTTSQPPSPIQPTPILRSRATTKRPRRPIPERDDSSKSTASSWRHAPLGSSHFSSRLRSELPGSHGARHDQGHLRELLRCRQSH